MHAMVFLLRGVNVGGRTTLAMAELRRVAADLGMVGARTYIRSGNLVARWDRTPGEAGAALERALADDVGLATRVIVRTAAELGGVVGASPFAAEVEDPTRLHVVFLEDEAEPALAGLDVGRFAPERVAAVGRELHLHLPGGMGRSPLAVALTRAGSGTGTARSWRTVTTLADLAAETA